VAVLGFLVGAQVCAQTSVPAQISTEFGFGYESQAAPLVKISPQGTFINIEGLRRLGGAHLRAGAQGFANWTLAQDWSVSLAGDASVKRVPSAPDLDFAMLSVQPALHVALASSSLGWGLTAQHIGVAGQPFRDVRGVLMDWTLADPDAGQWTLIAEAAQHRHRGELVELDARVASLVLQHHWPKPLVGTEALDLAAYLTRERNERGFPELSHRGAMLSASLQWRWLDSTWSAGAAWQKARFDDTAFAQEPMRFDRSLSWDLAAERALSAQHALRVEYSSVRNASTTPLYNNRYRQLAVTLHSSW
jgi:hypothetical protein